MPNEPGSGLVVGYHASHEQLTPSELLDCVVAAEAFQELGVDELIFDPTVPDLDQIDRLAEVLPPS